MPRPKLTYLFEAEYHDGRVYKQNPDDSSIKFPPVKDENGELQGKSCMADIQEDLENHLIRRFSLVGKGNRITVDLKLGNFYVNKLSVLLESDKLPSFPEHFDLVYYRQNTVDVNVTFNKKTKEAIKHEQQGGIFTEYFIGWRCTINGREFKQKLAVS